MRSGCVAARRRKGAFCHRALEDGTWREPFSASATIFKFPGLPLRIGLNLAMAAQAR